MINKIINGDCLEVMPNIPDKSVDAIICDLPYGSTACKRDSIIAFDKLWKQYKRIIKDGGAIVLTAREPFTSALLMSNPKMYKHKWVWNKKQSGSFQIAKYMPLQIEEDILVFARGKVNYYPQMRQGKMRKRGGAKEKSRVIESGLKDGYENYSNLHYPVNIIEIANPRIGKLHPTEKPVALFEYLIKTYTNPGDTVLDNCVGSGTTAIAAIRIDRNFIGIEKEENYYRIALCYPAPPVGQIYAPPYDAARLFGLNRQSLQILILPSSYSPPIRVFVMLYSCLRYICLVNYS